MFDLIQSSRSARRAPVAGASSFVSSPALLATGLVALLAACGGGSGNTTTAGGSSGSLGAVVAHPDPATPSQLFLVESNRGGSANGLSIVRTAWGRLVDIRDIDNAVLEGLAGPSGRFSDLNTAEREQVLGSGEIQHVDFPISERIVTDNVDFVLNTNAVTGETTLTILHDASDVDDVDAYTSALRTADDLIPIQVKSLDLTEIPPFSVTPRNSAIVMVLDDLVDASTISSQTIQLQTGNPPSVPFTNLRVLPDLNHGDLDEAGNFHTTRVIIDTTVSDIEAQEALSNGQLLQTSALGLPASVTTGQANAVLRIPTRRFLPSDRLLQNLGGATLTFSGDPVRDDSSATLDILRAFRTGGPTTVTGDLNNGYLLDLDPPQLIGSQSVQIQRDLATDTWELEFDVSACAVRPLVGDVVQQNLVFAEVIENAPAPSGDTVSGVRLRIVAPTNGALSNGPALFQSPFDPQASEGAEGCFLRFQPGPTLDPGVNGEVRGILTGATVSLRFSEPMDPDSLTPYDSFTVTSVDSQPTALDYVVARINRTGDLRQYSFVPALPLAHEAGVADNYFVTLVSGGTGPTDLAGNPLVDPLPQVNFQLEENQNAQDNAGIVLRFGSTDEIVDPGNNPEIRGQFLYDFQSEQIRPRPVTRFTGVVDRTQPVPSLMTPTPAGLQTPLAGLGSRLMMVWRYLDAGFALLDETTHNIDVEGLSWSPQGGSVFQETYDLFEISLAHSARLPDEQTNPNTLAPEWPASGVVGAYANNVLAGSPLTVVHERSLGYLVEAVTFPASTGTQMVRFPWNRGLAPSERTFFTWRDTSITSRGAPAGSGADPDILASATGVGAKIYGVSQVPTIGLPLLMDFKCFPSKELGLNGFDTNFAINSSARPNFRAFSTGGINDVGIPVTKNPDLETTASGGFNPSSNGAPTLATDNTLYLGQMDLVTRVSRVYTIWFDTESTAPTFVVPTVEPRPESQPEGTQLILAYRGASAVNAAELQEDAFFIDPYGNPWDGTSPTGPTTPAPPVFLNGDAAWKEDISEVQGARFIQVRMTFVSNSETSLTPVLSSLGLAFSR